MSGSAGLRAWVVGVLALMSLTARPAKGQALEPADAVTTTRQVLVEVGASGQTWTVAPSPGKAVVSASLQITNRGSEPVRDLTVWPRGYAADTASLIASVAPTTWADEHRARALYEYVRDHYYQWAAPSSWTSEGNRPATFFHFYGYGLCSDVATVLGRLFERAGYPTRIWNLGTPRAHVVAEVYYGDRWHMYDANWPAVFYLEDARTVASVQDLVARPALLDAAGPLYAGLRTIYASTDPDAVTPVRTADAEPDASLAWTLLPGDVLRFTTISDIVARDDNPSPPMPAYSVDSGHLQVRLAAGAAAGHARVVAATNVALRTRDGVLGWEPDDPSRSGDLIVRVDVPYPVRDLTARVEGATLGADASVAVGVQRGADAFLLAGSDFASGAFMTWPGVVDVDGLRTVEDDGLLPFVHPTSGDTPGTLLVRLEAAPGDRRLELSSYRRSTREALLVEWSTDGNAWTTAWAPGDQDVGLLQADVALPSWPTDMFLRTTLDANGAEPGAVGLRRLRVSGMRAPWPAPVWSSRGTSFDLDGQAAVPLGSAVAPRRGSALHGALVHVRLEAPSGQVARLEVLDVDAAFQTSRWSPARIGSRATGFVAAMATPGPLVVEHVWVEYGAGVPAPPSALAPAEGRAVDVNTRRVSWAAVDGAVAYEVRLCLDEGCLAPIGFEQVPAPPPAGASGRIDWTLGTYPSLAPGAVHFWSVRAIATYASAWTAPSAFYLASPPTLTIAPTPTRLDLPWITVSGTVSAGVSSLRWQTDRGDSGSMPVSAAWTLPLTLRDGTTEVIVTVVGDGGLETAERVATTVTPRVYLLAEGATGEFFDTGIAIANHADIEAPVRIRLMGEGGVLHEERVVLPARGRIDIDLDEKLPGTSTGIATEVTSLRGLPLSVERMMTWGAGASGAHGGRALSAASDTWYFAEGSQGFFDTFWLIVNPQDTPVQITATFLLDGGGTITEQVTVAPHGRVNLFAGAVPGLLGHSFAATFAATADVVVERATYFRRTTGAWIGGHASPGATSPATRWFFAEGATGTFFDTFILLANPNPSPALATITYLLGDGRTVLREFEIPPLSRFTVWADADPDLEAVEMSMVVEADLPIVAERAMYWPLDAPSWEDATAVLGARSFHERWGLADVRTGTARGYDTYLLIANTTDTAAKVRLTFHGDGGPPVERLVEVPARSRYTLGTAMMAPELAGRRVAALIEALDGAQVCVESAMYWDAGGQHWAAGVVRPATPLDPTP